MTVNVAQRVYAMVDGFDCTYFTSELVKLTRNLRQ